MDKEKKVFWLWFWRFWYKIRKPHYFGPLWGQHINVGMCGGAKDLKYEPIQREWDRGPTIPL